MSKFDEKKSIDFLYYLSCLTQEELEKDREEFYKLRNNLGKEYKEVFHYIYGDIFRISKIAESIYKKVLEK